MSYNYITGSCIFSESMSGYNPGSYFKVSPVIYNVILNYCHVSAAYNFQTGNNKIKLLMEYESGTQKVLFGSAVLAALGSYCPRIS
jgi:hypothetical protein